ncbi:MAG: hypothetical protein CUN55_18965, partial [Phototrophicales bacterium]
MVSKIIVALPVWGSEYLDRYLRIAMPSFCAQGNLLNMSGVSEHQIEFHYYTDGTGSDVLAQNALIYGVNGDVQVIFHDIASLDEQY